MISSSDNRENEHLGRVTVCFLGLAMLLLLSQVVFSLSLFFFFLWVSCVVLRHDRRLLCMSKRTRVIQSSQSSTTAAAIAKEEEEEYINRKSQRTEMSDSASNSFSADGALVEPDQAFLDRYSRQIGTYGMDTMTKLVSLKVLIVGCGGVGAEAAKNLALAGVHTISILDNRTPKPADLGVNFAIPESATTSPSSSSIAHFTCQLLHELNPMVRVNVVPELSEDVVKSHSVIVFTSAAPDLRMSTLTRWDNFCRSQAAPISFLLALQCGAIASVFVDHGPKFTVKDLDGRPALQKQILEVVHRVDKRGIEYTRVRFSTPEGQTPGALRDYTQVKFSDVKGLLQVNGDSINGKVFDGVCCTADAKNCVRLYPSLKSLGYSDYVTGGFIHEQKEIVEVTFRSLEDALIAPGEFITVSPMMDNVQESLVHVTVNGLLRYADANQGALPPIHDKAAADTVLSMVKSYMNENEKRFASSPKVAPPEPVTEDPNDDRPGKYPPPPPPLPIIVENVDEDFVRTASKLAAAELQPLAAFSGAVVAQEIVKMTGKYRPVHQFFHFHCAEVLPENADYNAPEFAVTGASRYDNIVALFGQGFAQKLQNLKLFMVGCGALGCENIKNFALSGICCGPSGSLVVTDNDRIEISNLSRQFLFREDNVGQPKSVAACNRMRQMNTSAKVDARQDFVSPNTQHLYPDAFWMQLDAVVNALDNIEARLYVDNQCVLFKKVLVEAGTMGTAGNVDIIVPGKTTSYSDGGAADETGGIPMCTLRNFPYIFDHCIEWARAQFDDLFVSPVQQTIQLIEDPAAFAAKVRREVANAENDGQRRTLLEKHVKSLKGIQSTLSQISSKATMADCIAMAYRVFHQNFRDRILDLQLSFPQDATKSNGEPFWSGHRTFPTAIDGNMIGDATTNPTASTAALEFLVAAANLFATMFGVHPEKYAPKFNNPNHRWQQEYRSHEWMLSEIKKLSVPEFHRSAVDGLDEETAGALGDQAAADENLRNEFDALLSAVESMGTACKGTKAEPLDFEKDDDDNFHIDFITAASNLRAINYSISPQDRMKVKMVAGKIIPAIATTTAAVTGLALVEFFKVLQGKDVSALRNGMIDVGTNNYVLFGRDAPIKKRTTVEKTYLPEKDYTWRKKVIRVPNNFTKYDRFEIDVTPSTTVREFAEKLLVEVNKTLPADAPAQYDVDGMGVGQGSLWNGSMKHSNTNRSLMEVIEQQKRSEGFPADRSFWATRLQFPDLQVTLSIDDDDDVDDVEVDPATIVLCIKSA